MTTTYRVFFSHNTLIPGQLPGEPLHRALARLRRIFLREIPIIAVAGVVVNVNGTVMQEGDLVSRISAIPILGDIKNQILVLHVKGNDSTRTAITSDMITYTTGGHAPVLPNLLISYLPPKEELDVSIYVRMGTVASTDNQYFSPFSAVTFRPTKEGLMEFIMELVRGFTKDEFNKFYKIGMEIFAKGGGVIHGERGVSALLESMVEFQSSLKINIEDLEKDLLNAIESK